MNLNIEPYLAICVAIRGLNALNTQKITRKATETKNITQNCPNQISVSLGKKAVIKKQNPSAAKKDKAIAINAKYPKAKNTVANLPILFPHKVSIHPASPLLFFFILTEATSPKHTQVDNAIINPITHEIIVPYALPSFAP